MALTTTKNNGSIVLKRLPMGAEIMKYVVRLDYATFAFTPGTCTFRTVQEQLAGGTDLHFEPVTHSGKENTPLISRGCGLFFKPHCGSVQNPHVLQVSGSGCELFRPTLPALAETLFLGGEQAHFRRLDFAFDVVMTRREWKEFICRVFNYEHLEQQRKCKKYSLTGSPANDSWTVYIGSRVSPRFFRIYNKTEENPQYQLFDENGNVVSVPEDSCVIRYECEFKYVRRSVNGATRIDDPSALFDFYYNRPDDLFEQLKKAWLSYGSDLVLPFDFENAEFVTDLQARNIKVISHLLAEESAPIVRTIAARADGCFEADDAKLRFVATHYGAYVLPILLNPYLLWLSLGASETKYGLKCPLGASDLSSLVSEQFEIDAQALRDYDEITEDDSFALRFEEFEDIDILQGKESLNYEGNAYWPL